MQLGVLGVQTSNSDDDGCWAGRQWAGRGAGADRSTMPDSGSGWAGVVRKVSTGMGS